MIPLFFVLVLAIKAILAGRFAPEVSRRFAWRPWDGQWVAAWLLVHGQFLMAVWLWLLGVERDWYGWQIPVGAVAYLAGHALHLVAMVVNEDFRPEIVAPKELCQHCLYRWLHHPGYAGLVWASLGQTLLLGHRLLIVCFWGYTALLVYRIVKEEQVLCQRMREN